MQEYFARKKVMMLKLAAAVHFSDSLDREITLTDIRTALELLDSVEPGMEAGMNASGGKNELCNYTKMILNHIKNAGGRIRRRDLLLKFTNDLTWEEIEKCLNELTIGAGLKTTQEDNEKIYYL